MANSIVERHEHAGKHLCRCFWNKCNVTCGKAMVDDRILIRYDRYRRWVGAKVSRRRRSLRTLKMTMDLAMLPKQQRPRPMAKGGDDEGGSAAAEVLTVEGETF